MSYAKRYSAADISSVAKELMELGLSARVITRLLGLSPPESITFFHGITSKKGKLSVIWKRYYTVKGKMQQKVALSSDRLLLEILSGYLEIETLIAFVEHTIITMRQLRSLIVPKRENGYALLLQGIFKRGIPTLQSRGDLRLQAERFILIDSPKYPRSRDHIRRDVCRAIAEKFRRQVVPPWPGGAAKIIDEILWKELDPKFDSREYFILTRHFGLDGYKGQTYRKIAKELRISAARVNQIKTEAFERLRRSHSRKLLESFLMTLGKQEESCVKGIVSHPNTRSRNQAAIGSRTTGTESQSV